jgi:hypothetical protein
MTPEQVADFLRHSPLKRGLQYYCENTEHTCTPSTCNERCLWDAAKDLARWMNDQEITGKVVHIA